MGVFGAIGAFSPYFPLWLEAHGFVGIGMSAVAVIAPSMSALGPPLVGALVDRRGARGNVILLASTMATVAMLALWCAAVPGGARGTTLFVVVFAVMLAFALCRTTLTMLTDVIAIEEARDYGRRRLWGSIGYMFAASSVGWVLERAGVGWLPLVITVPLAGAAFAGLALPRRAPPRPESASAPKLRGLLGERDFAIFLAASALGWAAHSGYDLCGPLFLRDLGATRDVIGVLWALGVLAEIGLMAVASKLLARVSAERLFALACAGAALRWFAMSALPSVGFAFFVAPLHALSFALMWVASMQQVRRFAERGSLGSAQGLLTASVALGAVGGILGWGPLYASHGGRAVFVVAGLLSLLASTVATLGLAPRQSQSP